ncbi:hypothetical protein HN51_054071, partial [Arachis hypogaea]
NNFSSTHAVVSLSSTAEPRCCHCCLLAAPPLSSEEDLTVPCPLHSLSRSLDLSSQIRHRRHCLLAAPPLLSKTCLAAPYSPLSHLQQLLGGLREKKSDSR